ncbi:cyclase family protein [Erythrobacter sp. GH1-10]|uniref:cyclase family protein n=1 Tax=Erythrobacter sp. GH1-10 TaxID=3349334 RepID=UPI003877CBA0
MTREKLGIATFIAAGLILVGCDEVGTGESGSLVTPPDPVFGMAGTLTPEHVRRAADLVTQGKVYQLGIVTGPQTPAWGNREFEMQVFDLGEFGSNKLTGHDDKVVTHIGIGSQIDGFGHIGLDRVYYGGVTADEMFAADGLEVHGAHNIPPIATRGVVIDIAKHFGVDVLDPLTSYDAEDIRAAAEAQGVEIRPGDVVLLHTGWLSRIAEAETFGTRQPGINLDGARYLAELGVVAVGSDTPGLESDAPNEEGAAFPVHAHLLAEKGIHILENMNTTELISDDVSEFFFVLGTPRLEGSVQAIINPIAIR